MMYQYLSQMPPKALGTRPLDSVSLVQSLEQPLMPSGAPIESQPSRKLLPKTGYFYRRFSFM